jgi:hypothetical protein
MRSLKAAIEAGENFLTDFLTTIGGGGEEQGWMMTPQWSERPRGGQIIGGRYSVGQLHRIKSRAALPRVEEWTKFTRWTESRRGFKCSLRSLKSPHTKIRVEELPVPEVDDSTWSQISMIALDAISWAGETPQ